MSGLTICERCKHEKLINSFCKLGIIGTVLKRAGHPIAQASAAAGKIEFLNVPEADEWDVCMWVRYRSRSDFSEIIIETWGSEHHSYKLDAVERTFAFPLPPGLCWVGRSFCWHWY
jgi:hypothetical protein